MTTHRPRTSIALIAAVALGLTACGSATENTGTEPVTPPADTTVGGAATAELQRFPDVVDATATASNGAWTFDVTMSSPYDSPERYADGWRILGPDGTEYGFRELTHDHASEQPFTRSLSGVVIPESVDTVTIEGRDQQYGFGGDTFELALPGA